MCTCWAVQIGPETIHVCSRNICCQRRGGKATKSSNAVNSSSQGKRLTIKLSLTCFEAGLLAVSCRLWSCAVMLTPVFCNRLICLGTPRLNLEGCIATTCADEAAHTHFKLKTGCILKTESQVAHSNLITGCTHGMQLRTDFAC